VCRRISPARWIVASALALALALGVAASPPHALAAAPQDPFATASVGKNLPDEKISAAEAERRAQIAWERGDSNWAVYYYVLAIKHGAPPAPAFAKIGAIEAVRGDAVRAQRAFEMAYAADPKDPAVADELAGFYIRERRIDDAAKLYGEVLTTEPTNSRALDGMGEVMLARRAYARAVQYFTAALAGPRADVGMILGHRGFAKLLLHDWVGANEDLRIAVHLDPHSVAWRYLAELQVRQNDPAGAFASLLHSMDAAHAYNEIGRTYLRLKDYSRAAGYFVKAVRASPSWYGEAETNLALAKERAAAAH